ncbi:MAG TPA: hypothetical protein VK829_06070 [Terriglobales bacterium]|nr:hypothetical protein [Terriglobales bacterium]
MTTSSSSAPCPGEAKPAPQAGTQFVARQPILGADEKVFGYGACFAQYIEHMESGEWKTVSELAGQLHLVETDVAECYWQAMQWAREVSGGS